MVEANMSRGPDSVAVYMHQLLEEYDKSRGISVSGNSFWDAVIISAADDEQQKAYQHQIGKKLDNGELPLGIEYMVVSDPPGPAIGNGGSTLNVLEELYHHFKKELLTMRILLIHAGGSSKRLPTASVLGKLFVPLPLGTKLYQMLDLKLAMYLPFLKRMAPGIFVTCSDDIETFVLTDSTGGGDLLNWSFDQLGFTALAHKSNIETGKHHGVYILPKADCSDNKNFTFGTCLQVLQKPSEDLMQKKGAIIHGDQVCTDSVFFFTHDISLKLVEFYRVNKPLNCEVDAYNDFLQCLGSHADRGYIRKGKSTSDRLFSIREQLFSLLNGASLNILLLHNSYFYHLGTCTEYVDNLTSRSELFSDLGMISFVHSKVVRDHIITSTEIPELGANVTVMCSVILSSLCCRRPVVIEYSRLESDLQIGEYSILSGCHVMSNTVLHIPPYCVMHTVAVSVNNVSGFVTIAFGALDDLKTSVPVTNCGELLLFGHRLKELAHIFKTCDVFPQQAECNLWTGRFFTLCSTMSDSFHSTLHTIQAIHLNKPKQPTASHQLSMAEVIQYKDVKQMLAFRDGILHNCI